jgi:uncharacterized protein involved in response to NO
MSALVNLFHVWVAPSAIVALDYNYENDTGSFKVTALLSTGASIILKEVNSTQAAKDCMAQCVQILLDYEKKILLDDEQSSEFRDVVDSMAKN